MKRHWDRNPNGGRRIPIRDADIPLEVEIGGHRDLREGVVYVVLQIVVLFETVCFKMKLAELVGEAVGYTGDDDFVAPGLVVAGETRTEESQTIAHEQRVELIQGGCRRSHTLRDQ